MTEVSWYAYIDRLVEERDRQYQFQFTAAHDALVAHARFDEAAHEDGLRALQKSEASLDRRLENMNEFRAQLSDQASKFLTRIEYDAKHEDLVKRIEALGLALGDRLTTNGSRIDRIEARSGGLNAGWSYLIAAIGALTSIIAIVLVLVIH